MCEGVEAEGSSLVRPELFDRVSEVRRTVQCSFKIIARQVRAVAPPPRQRRLAFSHFSVPLLARVGRRLTRRASSAPMALSSTDSSLHARDANCLHTRSHRKNAPARALKSRPAIHTYILSLTASPDARAHDGAPSPMPVTPPQHTQARHATPSTHTHTPPPTRRRSRHAPRPSVEPFLPLFSRTYDGIQHTHPHRVTPPPPRQTTRQGRSAAFQTCPSTPTTRSASEGCRACA